MKQVETVTATDLVSEDKIKEAVRTLERRNRYKDTLTANLVIIFSDARTRRDRYPKHSRSWKDWDVVVTDAGDELIDRGIQALRSGK